MKIAILSIGNELLSGKTMNTNANWLGNSLTKIGCRVDKQVVVPDKEKPIINALNFLINDKEGCIIVTGGLGPTDDDRTRFIISEISNKKLIFDDNSLDRLTKRLEYKKISIKENNKRQCWFPEGSIIIPNENGTASGFIINFQINNESKIIAALPGPPNENKDMINNNVIPLLIKNDFIFPQYKLRWTVKNYPESNLSADLDPIAKKYKIEIAYRIHKPYCDIKIDLPKDEHKNKKKLLNQIKDSVLKIIGNHL